MISQRLKETNASYCDRLFKLSKPKFIKSYDCSMKCYRDSQADLENCDKCSSSCEKDLADVRIAQSQLMKSMASFKECAEACGNEKDCVWKCFESYYVELKTALDNLA
mmetsp:Transcript_10177/g.19938  ORF Transcript_10177/g.19938 Transcript_10177/m.19938 type:complete len:108 (-) Transcript_10177:81-404(-)|eukprot:CAMPEP_0204905180 /NCGR_PEP_ID=MMETSP1397-20131031/5286_1 /ASSEMBLY_ACC=CAM_ASM_000891 /TAXON_ID=49980 /ORGANISM="Climacostomum Climacostomum virens, Strain Stock W-24" /LENGTH=107 /DNA_ID=CAMNT_0052074049 /DNA_START=3 /DNA_END=326 /DNA_ORIENTATION=+